MYIFSRNTLNRSLLCDNIFLKVNVCLTHEMTAFFYGLLNWVIFMLFTVNERQIWTDR